MSLRAAVCLAATCCLASAASAVPRTYRCKSDHGLTLIEGAVQAGYGFNPTLKGPALEKHFVSLYPWGVVLSFEGTTARVAKDKSGLPDKDFMNRAQGPGPNFRAESTPGTCVFKADNGAPVPVNATKAVQACMTKGSVVDNTSVRHNYGIIVHPDLLAGVPRQDAFAGFTLHWFQPSKGDQFFHMTESFGCERVK